MTSQAGALLTTLLGIRDSFSLISSFKPDACLGVGGYASFPVVVAAALKGIHTAIEEQNATPGLANKVLARLAKRIYASDEVAARAFPPAKTLICGTPIRTCFAEPFPYEPPQASKPTRVLVLGGSQGASSLNRLVPTALSMVTEPLQIRHQAGRGKEGEVRPGYAGKEGVAVEAFIDDMTAAYSWAQVVIARAGALTLAELAAAVEAGK